MKSATEKTLRVFIFVLVLILLVVELLKIDIQIWEILIKVVVLVLTVVIIVVEVRKKKMCHGFIYQHKENRSIVYCNNDQGNETRDFVKIGDGQVPCELTGDCFFVK